jgi:monothiol glutaredoxin
VNKIEERIINSAVVIFMKGKPEQTRCGFFVIPEKALIACGEDG